MLDWLMMDFTMRYWHQNEQLIPGSLLLMLALMMDMNMKCFDKVSALGLLCCKNTAHAAVDVKLWFWRA